MPGLPQEQLLRGLKGPGPRLVKLPKMNIRVLLQDSKSCFPNAHKGYKQRGALVDLKD